jgi:hypothetical protein
MSAIFIPRKSFVLFALRSCSAGILAGILLFRCALAPAQSKLPDSAAEILGTWEGESKCKVPSSPCHDEHVIYEIATERTATSSLKLDAYKIVNGERQFMGTLRCDYKPSKKNLSCTFRNKDYDDWEYTLSGDTLQGTLTIDGGETLYRRVSVKRRQTRKSLTAIMAAVRVGGEKEVRAEPPQVLQTKDLPRG